MNCPKCACEYAYQDGELWTCPECAHEWSAASDPAPESAPAAFRDANGAILASGDAVSLVKDLKVKGSSSTVKSGTKVKNIRLLADPVDGHDIACKIDGVGAIYLKSEFVRKV